MASLMLYIVSLPLMSILWLLWLWQEIFLLHTLLQDSLNLRHLEKWRESMADSGFRLASKPQG
jgi:hypothetical protein